MRSAFGMILTLVLAVFFGIVGYSIAAPVIERLSAEAESPTTVPAETTTTAMTEMQTETTSAAALTTSAPAETTVTTTATEPAVTRFAEPVQLAYCLPEESLTDPELLELTAESLRSQGYTAMVFPLKTAGGKLLYASETEAASVSNAFDADAPSLADLAAVASLRNMQCMARFDTLNDNIYPAAYQNGAYCIADEGGRWLDTAEERGGKPWISPFTDAARAYLSSLCGEITDAGFTGIYCTDLMFPYFRDSDVSLLGSYVNDSVRRRDALAAVMTEMVNAAPGAVYTCGVHEENNTETIGAIAADAPVCVMIAPADPASAAAQLTEAVSLIEGRELIPWVLRGAMDDASLNAVLDSLYEAGYRKMVVSES